MELRRFTALNDELNKLFHLSPPLFQDPARSVGFHPSGAVVAVGTMTGRSVSHLSPDNSETKQ